MPFRVGLVYKDNSAKLMGYLESRGIETRTFFYPLHRQPCYNTNHGNFEQSVYAYEHGICMPSHVGLTEKEIRYVCECLNNYEI